MSLRTVTRSSSSPTDGQSRPTNDRRKSFGARVLRKVLSPLQDRGNMSESNLSPVGARGPSTSRKPRLFPSCRKQMPSAVVGDADTSNPFHWLENDCPMNLLPYILAYAGPQTTCALSKTNKFWRDAIDKESTWKVLCEELYKWKEGNQIPESWFDYYKRNPCVPIDYSSVESAFHHGPNGSTRLLLRPGKYYLRQAINVRSRWSATVTVETMQMPYTYTPAQPISEIVEVDAPRSRTSSTSSLRDILTCRNVQVEDPDDSLSDIWGSSDSSLDLDTPSLSSGRVQVTGKQRAVLVMRTQRADEPIVRVQQGCVVLRNLELQHCAYGTDIWNGNAAVQIQPPNGLESRSTAVPPSSTTLEFVDICSHSGRGVVNIDGGHLTIKNCAIHDCAATGLYVGGAGSKATVERTDVIRNGRGNRRHRRGIGRGHSGVYLEQGNASIVDCNISGNSLTGISAVSPENAVLYLEESDLVSNGAPQLELPSIGSFSHRNSTARNNNMASIGLPRPRSGLVVDGL
eukprot:Nitzschia sp. Nitz4//scaffold69_size99277//56415//58111//NITZ4_004634-RA/size99277-augustus-gene-0.4-mRNA-1//1//CDS//3329556718//1034//frame0